MTRRTVNATFIFNWAVWSCRRTHFTQVDRHETVSIAAAHISTFAITYWNRHVPPRWQTSGHAHSPPDPALLGPSPYGSAGKRTDRQKRKALAFGKSKLAKIPDGHFIAYTDGASKGNSTKKRSPCGAGALLELPRRDGVRKCVEEHAALGSNTNNFGELWGLGMALSLFLTYSQPGDTLHSLTDSAHASLTTTKHHKPSSNRALAYAVRKLYYNALKDRHVRIEWVPAHVGIEGNELADGLADEGARQSGLGLYIRPLELLRRISEGHFTSTSSALRCQPAHPRRARPGKRRSETPPPAPRRARAVQTQLPSFRRDGPPRLRPPPAPIDQRPAKRVKYTQRQLGFDM